MSTSFLAEKDRIGQGYFQMKSTAYKKHCNDAGSVSLRAIGNNLIGLQKMSGVQNPRSGQRQQNKVNWSYFNSPPSLREWGTTQQDQANDPFGEMYFVEHGGYGSSYCAANASMFGVRKNANAAEKIRWSFKLTRGRSTHQTSTFGIVAVTYPDWNRSSEAYQEVQFANTEYMPSTRTIEIDLPANGHKIVELSLQNTAPHTSSGSIKYGCGIYDYKCEYL